ncbi:MAG: SLC13 family permease [Gemmatimonadota bacterium]|nr:SLC13 family permease [Gemmatimonadota bacterium]
MHETVLASTTDPISQLIIAAMLVALFRALALEKAHRVLVVLGAVAGMWGITYLTPYRLLTLEGATRALDLNVLLLLAAMMALVGVFKSTGVFAWGVDKLLAQFDGQPVRAITALWWFTAICSAFADNVTTVIFVTPIVLAIVRRLGVPPLPVLLPLVMAANIGGTATLIGDPPNIMIGSGAGLSFLDFIRELTIPTLLMMCGLHWWGARWLRGAMASATNLGAGLPDVAAEITDPGLLRWMIAISAMVFLGFVTHGVTGTPAAVPAVLGAALALIIQDVRYLRTHRPSHEERVHGILHVLEHEVEWPTLTFFTLLFILVGAAVETGLIATLAGALERAIAASRVALGLGDAATMLFAAILVLWVAGVLSALMDNIPFVAVTIPIIAQLTTALPGDGRVLWWALALGACLGGNGTPIGASANVTTIGLAEREGVRIGFMDFVRTGAKVTTFTLVVSTAFLVGYVHLGPSAVALTGGGVLAVAAFALWRSGIAARPVA